MSCRALLAALAVVGLAGMSAAAAAADPVVPELRPVAGGEEERYVRYLDRCIEHIERYVNQHYPKALRGKHGVPYLQLTILSDGRLESVDIIRSSGNRWTDRAAVDVVKRASPLLPFPDEILETTDAIEWVRAFIFSSSHKLTIER